MEQLGLDITRAYKDLYSFDSKRVRLLGVTKDSLVNLDQIVMKSVVVDIVVADITTRFSILLSRSSGSNIGGSIKLDLMCATIPIFSGEERWLYRESRFIKIVTRYDFSRNSLVYGNERDLSSLMLGEDDFMLEEPWVQPASRLEQQLWDCSIAWKLYFDGKNSKQGNGGVLLISLEGMLIPISFKFKIEETNNLPECESLLLGLQATNNLNIECLTIWRLRTSGEGNQRPMPN